KVDIEQDQVGRLADRLAQPIRAIRGGVDLVVAVALELEPQRQRDVRVVLDDEDPCHVLWSGSLSAESAGCLITRPSAMKTICSPMFVAWSPIRSKYFATNIRRNARVIVLGSSIMYERSSRKTCSMRSSRSSSIAMTARAAVGSRCTKASSAPRTICCARRAM